MALDELKEHIGWGIRQQSQGKEIQEDSYPGLVQRFLQVRDVTSEFGGFCIMGLKVVFFVALQCCVSFSVQQCGSAVSIHTSPPFPAAHSLSPSQSSRSLQTWAPYAVQRLPPSSLVYTWSCICQSQFPYSILHPPCPPVYVCISVFALETGSSAPFF